MNLRHPIFHIDLEEKDGARAEVYNIYWSNISTDDWKVKLYSLLDNHTKCFLLKNLILLRKFTFELSFNQIYLHSDLLQKLSIFAEYAPIMMQIMTCSVFAPSLLFNLWYFSPIYLFIVCLITKTSTIL